MHAFEIIETVTEVVYDTDGNYIGKVMVSPKGDSYEAQVENLNDVAAFYLEVHQRSVLFIRQQSRRCFADTGVFFIKNFCTSYPSSFVADSASFSGS